MQRGLGIIASRADLSFVDFLVHMLPIVLIVPPMNHIDLLDWTSFDAAIELGYRTTMETLDKARSLPVGARLFLA